MRGQNRNLLFIVIAGVLVLCCCSIVIGGFILSYLIVRPSDAPGITRQVEVVTRLATTTPIVRPTATPTARPTGAITPAPTGPEAAAPSPQSQSTPIDTETLLRDVVMPTRDLRELKLRLDPSVSEIPLVVNATPPVFEVGDKASFWVDNSDTQEHRQITAELRYMTTHLYMWVEQGVSIDLADLKASADRFEDQSYPTNREFFGSEWTPGVDNDVRLSVLHARGLGDTVAGYFSSADEFSHLINPYSNEREMFYISADSDSAEPNTSFYDATLAHEFQHMIHWAQDRNEDSWVNEGMSELAGHLNGFDVGGADVAYAEKPDTQLTTWSDPSEGNIEHYGASFLFMAYFLDRFGEDLTKAVVSSPENGVAGFNHALQSGGRTERFDDIFADWLIANYLDEPDAAPDGRFGYQDLDPETPKVVESLRRYPASATAKVSNYGVDYIRLRGSGDLTIEFEGQTQAKLVDTEPQDSFGWWSNRGDDSNMTLTRAFDLRGLTKATLRCSLWYDIEEGWDYAYVEASVDGGEKWTILSGRHTTSDDPVGNAFGDGWTGLSGGRSTPAWVEEEIDLTPFAGKEILLRFEYVTDDAVNEPGLLLDNIEIPELDYLDGGENGMAGWNAEGWVLIDNRLTQRWLVQLLEIDSSKITLLPLEVGPDGRGELELDGIEDLDHAVLVISAQTPVTTAPASYTYRIVSR